MGFEPITPKTSRQPVPNEVLAEAYNRLGNIWLVAKEVGLCGQSVHERLIKLGLQKKLNVFTSLETDRLKREYNLAADAGQLGVLAAEMGRTRQFLCRQARKVGLTDPGRPRVGCAVWKYAPIEYAEPIWEKFKNSRLGLGKFCASKGYDDLGFSRRMAELFPDEYEHVIELKLGRNRRYAVGRRHEYAVRDTLRSYGFFVMRSAGSKSPVDLLAVRKSQSLMVQCKTSGALPPAEWNAIFDLAEQHGSIPVMAERAGRRMVFWRLLERKDGSKRRQPMEEFAL